MLFYKKIAKLQLFLYVLCVNIQLIFSMKREIDIALLEWKSRLNRKPLMIRGARQVGKTYSVEEFARKNFENYLKINLEKNTELKSLFKTPDITRIVNELSVLFNIDIIPGKSLIFIDEIQACPEAIVALRYFYEQYPKLHVITAGSLLDHTLKEMNYSMPVGRVEFLHMYPMNFKEFLIALAQDKLLKYINDYSFDVDFSSVIHKKILEHLRLYIFIGGMPEAVKSYSTLEKLTEIERIQSNILQALEYDFAKYGTRRQQEYLVTVLRYSSRNTGNKVKYSNVDRNVRSVYLKEAFHRLELSRLINLVKHTNSSRVPLANGINGNIFKPVFLDIGLANHLGRIKLIDIQNILTTNEGALAEQFIGQELLTQAEKYSDPQLFYWTREERSSNAEIDYIYQEGNMIFPIEVKAGKSGSLKSMHVYLYEKKLKTGIRFNLDLPSMGTFESKVKAGKKSGTLKYNLISLPLYMCFHMSKLLRKIRS